MTEREQAAVSMQTLREVVERLAPINRTPCSAGEAEAAAWLADRFRSAGCREVTVESEPSWGTFAPMIAGIGLFGIVGGLFALAGKRLAGELAMGTAAIATIDEAQNGPRIFRRLLKRKQKTVNVIARIGDPNAKQTLVLLAHHDAAQTGVIFDQSLQKSLHQRWPALIESQKNSPPQWWIGLAAPFLGIAGALTRRRALSFAGLGVGVLGTGLVADIWRSPTVPGANDNLSGVAVLVAVAEMMNEQPIDGLDVWLVSCGAEETLQDGIRGFIDSHGVELRARHASVLNFDTVGSTHLAMLEGEGPIWMEDYHDPAFRDMIAGCASASGIELERGLRARSSTDSVITSRAGLPSTCLVSLTEWRGLANYHLMSDTPENLDYETVAHAAQVAYEVAKATSA